MTTGWHFQERHPADDVQNPIQAEFFDEATDPDEKAYGLARPFVRETIQNSLDARLRTGQQWGDGSERVHVRIVVGTDDTALPEQTAKRWFGDLWPHLRGHGSGLRGVPTSPPKCRMLLIEDFGTRGLEGSIERWKVLAEGEEDDFFAFFRADGLSGKSGQLGGRWGVGKSVFNRASRFNLFLALTVRSSDERKLLFGKCVLRHHSLRDEVEYKPYGRYGVQQENNFVLPVETQDLIEQFCKDFRLARKREEGAPGLSVVVPFCESGLTAQDVVHAVVREYFEPILAGRLAVTIESASLPEDTIALTEHSIVERLDKLGEDEFRPVVELAAWGREIGASQAIQLDSPSSGKAPQWSDELFPTGDDLEELSDRYRRGERLAFRAQLTVRRTDGSSECSFFQIYLQRDLQGRGNPPVFIRNGIIVSKALQRRVAGHHLNAVVVIDDEPLAELLGDAEPPAHTHWSPDTGNFRGKYRTGQQVIDFVRTAPRRIAEFLGRAQEKRDRLILADFFPSPDDADGLGERDEPDTEVGSEETQRDIEVTSVYASVKKCGGWR